MASAGVWAGRVVGACVVASGCVQAYLKYGQGNKKFSPQEVAAHNTSQDCWIIIDKGVYDVTQWLDKHPGLCT